MCSVTLQGSKIKPHTGYSDCGDVSDFPKFGAIWHLHLGIPSVKYVSEMYILKPDFNIAKLGYAGVYRSFPTIHNWAPCGLFKRCQHERGNLHT